MAGRKGWWGLFLLKNYLDTSDREDRMVLLLLLKNYIDTSGREGWGLLLLKNFLATSGREERMMGAIPAEELS